MHRITKTVVALIAFALLIPTEAGAGVPATPVMTLYKFNGSLNVPYYTIESFEERGPKSPAGTLAQGTSVIPCLAIRDGKPLTDKTGTPYVGFKVLINSRKAAFSSTEKFKRTVAQRASMTVPNHHCDDSMKHVISVRWMYALGKAPFFQTPGRTVKPKASRRRGKKASLDEIVRAFHNSPQCEAANRKLIGRRGSLDRAWERFIAANANVWPHESLERAKQLDYTMRTAIYEGHLDRGCSAYGACERDIVALSIRNRGDSCLRSQGCGFPGDYQGVATKVSQYNIWDEYLTQISGLTACFLRSDLIGRDSTAPGEDPSRNEYYDRISSMYEQNVADVEKILYGDDRALRKVFPKTSLGELKAMRHYYHAPAMGKCFPKHPRVEYMSGAVAWKGDDFALIANTRIKVGKKVDGGYLFRLFKVNYERDRDVTSVVNAYPGFVVDGRKVSLKRSSRCVPYGVPRGCAFKRVTRYRKTPGWLRAGRPLEIRCRVRDRGESCRERGHAKTVGVGGSCDTEMRPVAGIR